MADPRAVELWEKLLSNLIERELIPDRQTPDLDAEQVAAIEWWMGKPDAKGLAACDKAQISLTKDKTNQGVPFLVAFSSEFKDCDGYKAHIFSGHALTIECIHGQIKVTDRRVTW